MKKAVCLMMIILAILPVGCANLKITASNNGEAVTKNDDIGGLRQSAEDARPDIPQGWKVYKYTEYGYEVAYPENYNVSISGGHSPLTSPELEMRLSIASKDNQLHLDIDSINKTNFSDKYRNIEEYIRYNFDDRIIPYDYININNARYMIYKLQDGSYYFSFFENNSHIFELSCPSAEFLKEIMKTFVFTRGNAMQNE